MLFPDTGTISASSALTRLDLRRRRWLLPCLVRLNLPWPVNRKRLDVDL